jgi:soluble lytic murein transglycosylase
MAVLALGALAVGPALRAARAGGADVPVALARYRDAHRALAAGEYADARRLFEALAAAPFLLGDYAAFYSAEASLRAGAEELALQGFRAFPERFPDSLLGPAALLAAHDTAFRLGRFAEAEREARRFLARAPNHPEAGRVLVRLAEARAAQGLVAEAIVDLRRRWIEAPASAWGEAAREIAEELARGAGLAVAPLGPEEQLLLAQRLADAGEQSVAARTLETLLAQGPDAGVRHRALARLAPLLGRLGRGADGIGRLSAALDEPATGSRPGLLYELGRLLARHGQPARAVPVFERLLAEHPEASLAADAWLQLARARLDLQQPEPARGALRGLIAAHPASAAAAAARWELAWQEYRAGRLREAAQAFRQLAAAGSAGSLGGLYWAGRSLEALGERLAAMALYRDVLGRGPNTYYGILAARRHPAPPPSAATPALRLPADPLIVLRPEVPYQKAQALAAVGFEAQAVAELESLGRDGATDLDRGWGLGVAFAELGEAGRSLRHLRRALGAAAEAGAPGIPPRFWHLYYPLAYGETVREAARTVGLDPYFVAAVIREESSYDARARSWVGAVGLMQLMPDTARLVAQEIGLTLAETALLWEPPINITLGTRYLAQLRARFRDPLLAVAGYNAGPHRVQRWLGERPGLDIEEFVDQIPFDETRAFAKRVATSWHHYRRLYGAPGGLRGESEATPRLAR